METKEEELIVITKREYLELWDAARVLDALHAGGVDNWEGYEDAIELYIGTDYEDAMELYNG